MIRALVFLVGSSVLGAILAAAYYAPDSLAAREDASAYNMGPGGARQDTVHPSLPGSSIVYEVDVREGIIDVYVMERPWAASLSGGGDLDLSRPFSYDAALSKTHVNGTYTFTIISDGVTSYTVVFDNSDNYYDGDAGEEGNITDARVRATARFIEEEQRSLTLGYIAAVPSVLLVAVTFGRQFRRWLRERSEPGEGR